MAKSPHLANIRDYSALATEIDELKFCLSNKDEEIQTLKNHLSQAQNELEATRRQLYDKKAEYNRAEEKIGELTADVGKWRMIANSKGSSLPRQTESNTQFISQLQQELAQQKQEVILCRQAITQKEHELKEYQEKWAKERRNSIPPDHYRVQVQQVQSELYQVKDENSRLSELLRARDDELRHLRRQNGGYGGSAVSSYEVENCKSENRRLSQEIKAMQEKNYITHQQLTAYEEDYKRERREKDSLNDRLAAALELNHNLQAVIDTLQQDQAAARGGGDRLDVRPEDHSGRGGYMGGGLGGGSHIGGGGGLGRGGMIDRNDIGRNNYPPDRNWSRRDSDGARNLYYGGGDSSKEQI